MGENSKKLNLDSLSLFSHELKTPLSSLKIALDIIKKSKSLTETTEMLQLMEEEVDWMQAFINDQLDLKLIQKKEDLFCFQWSSWDKVLYDSLKPFVLVFKKYNINLQINQAAFNPERLPDSGIEIWMDRAWMGQVIKNLISNAWQNTPKTKTIYLDYEISSSGELKVVLCNAKNLLFKKDKETLCEQDYLRIRSCHEGLKSTGLGLMIVKEILKKHQAKVEVKWNQEDYRFLFQLPQARQLKKSA